MRRHLLQDKRRAVGVRPPKDHPVGLRDATMISVLAYAGPRPGEQLALRWSHVQRRLLRFYAPKTTRERTVRILAPLAEDLAEYCAACGNPDDSSLVFPRIDGTEWVETDWRNWRADVFYAARDAVGLPAELVPYDLRHSFVSLLLAEGQSVLEVARQAGHSPQTCLRTYAHLFDEYDPTERVSAEGMIRAARSGALSDAAALLQSFEDRPIHTVTGRENRVLKLEGDDVLV
jgi:integrase